MSLRRKSVDLRNGLQIDRTCSDEHVLKSDDKILAELGVGVVIKKKKIGSNRLRHSTLVKGYQTSERNELLSFVSSPNQFTTRKKSLAFASPHKQLKRKNSSPFVSPTQLKRKNSLLAISSSPASLSSQKLPQKNV